MRPRPVYFALATLLAGCPSDGPGPSGPVATTLAILTPPATTAESGVPLAQQPAVQLRDAAGQPVAQSGVLVTAVIAAGGGTLVGTAGVRTDAGGTATWTDLGLAGTVGLRTLRFEAAGLVGVAAAPILLGAGRAGSLAPVAGNNQVAAAGTALAVLPRVLATDASGNPVPGASVTFEVTGGGGAVAGAVQLTGADGTAAPGSWTLGPVVGPNALTARLTDGTGPLLSFSATGTVGPPAHLEVVEGDGQSATIGTQVAVAPGVRVTDAFANPVPGVTVTFTVASGGGTLTGATPVSNAAGIARVQGWTLGFVAGPNTLSATRAGVAPVTVAATGVAFVVSGISVGSEATCAVSGSGAPWCWGGNAGGQLGDGTVTPRPTAGSVTGGLSFTQVAAGNLHACGLTAVGAAWCWGANGSGQLGDGSLIDRLSPVAVGGGHLFSRLAVGTVHTCGLRQDGEILCWGANNNGRLGDGTNVTRPQPTLVIGGPWTAVTAENSSHTCALKADNSAWCWGLNSAGRLGDGTVTDRPVATAVIGGHLWQALSAGGGHTCGITTSGAAFCWGAGTVGQLGTGSASNQSIPVPVAGGLSLSQISAGTAHTCAVTTTQAVHCWGQNGSGRLGDGTTATQLSPVPVAGGFLVDRVVAGGEHTCARTTAGAALCWGRNLEGQLGDGATTSRLTPVAVKPPAP